MIKNIILLFLVLFVSNAQSMKLEPGDILAGFVQVQPETAIQATMDLGQSLSVDKNGILYGIVDGGINQTNLVTGEQRTIFPNGIPSTFTGMTLDDEGQIIAYEGSSFSKIDPTTGEHTVITSGRLIESVSSIAMDINGDILVGGRDFNFQYRLFRINPNTGTVNIITDEVDESDRASYFSKIISIIINSNGDYIIRDWNNRFLKIDRETGFRINIFQNSSFYDVNGNLIILNSKYGFGGLIDANNNIIVINNRELIRINSKTNVVETLLALSDRSLSTVIPYKGDEILLKARDGIIKINLTTLEFETVMYPDRLKASTSGRAITTSPNKDIFFARDTTVSKVNPLTGESTVIASNGLLSKVNAIAIEKNGNILVSNNDRLAVGGSIIRINPETGAQTLVTIGENIKTIRDIALDSKGILYVLTTHSTDDLACIIAVDPDSGEQSVVNIIESEFSSVCKIMRRDTSLAVEKSGNIVVSMFSAVLRLERASGIFTHLAPREDMMDKERFDKIEDIDIAPDGSIVILDEISNLRSILYRLDPVTAELSIISSSGFLLSFATLQCKCLSVVPDDLTNSLQNPAPSILANGQKQTLLLQEGQNLAITISLKPGIASGQKRDWWVATVTPFGIYWLDSQLQWGQSTEPLRAYAGPLVTLSDFRILNPISLPPGNYTFYFAVDNNADSILDAHNISSVEVSIQ